MTSLGDQVPSPSVQFSHASGKPSSKPRNTPGVRARIARASDSANGVVNGYGLLRSPSLISVAVKDAAEP